MMEEFGQRLTTARYELELILPILWSRRRSIFVTQMKEDAQNRVRVSLTLEAIAKAENIEVTEEDINAELEKMSAQFDMDC